MNETNEVITTTEQLEFDFSAVEMDKVEAVEYIPPVAQVTIYTKQTGESVDEAVDKVINFFDTLDIDFNDYISINVFQGEGNWFAEGKNHYYRDQ